MITPLGFIDTSTFGAMFQIKYKERMNNGVLMLRDVKADEIDPSDLAIMKEWKSARAILQRIRSRATEMLKGETALGRSFVETLPPQTGLPWTLETSAYSDSYLRLRICLFSAPGCWSFSGMSQVQPAVGIVNLVENRQLCSELNLSDHPRTHVVVDVKRPDVEA